MDFLNGEACHLEIQIVYLKESGINLFGRGRDRGMDFLNGEWCRLKIRIVHLIESYSVLGEIRTVMGVMPINIA